MPHCARVLRLLVVAAGLLSACGAAPLICGAGAALAFDGASQRCCRVCGRGKACGDSCIARDKTCTRGRGCACDG
jgi:hypothetical protein